MHGPSLVGWLLVALSAAAAVSCLSRSGSRDEALTGAGMAVMAVPVSVFDPGPWVAPVLAAVFAAAALHAVGRTAAHRTPGGHRAHHAMCSAAMAYMAAAMAGHGSAHAGHEGHEGHAAAGAPLLTGLLLLYFTGYVLRMGLLVAMPAFGGPIPAAAGPAGGPPRPTAEAVDGRTGGPAARAAARSWAARSWAARLKRSAAAAAARPAPEPAPAPAPAPSAGSAGGPAGGSAGPSVAHAIAGAEPAAASDAPPGTPPPAFADAGPARPAVAVLPGVVAAQAGAGRARLRHAPEVAVACRVAMALGMLAMLAML